MCVLRLSVLFVLVRIHVRVMYSDFMKEEVKVELVSCGLLTTQRCLHRLTQLFTYEVLKMNLGFTNNLCGMSIHLEFHILFPYGVE